MMLQLINGLQMLPQVGKDSIVLRQKLRGVQFLFCREILKYKGQRLLY